jgi:hypothetical protein
VALSPFFWALGVKGFRWIPQEHWRERLRAEGVGVPPTSPPAAALRRRPRTGKIRNEEDKKKKKKKKRR